MMPREFPTNLLEFQRMFHDEEACTAYLEEVRWPDGFECRFCGHKGEAWKLAAHPGMLRCPKCRKDTSLTAGTIMHRTKQPLHVWFWAAYLVTTQTPGMSALQFQRQLGLTRYETAFQMFHKLRAAMVRPDRDRIGEEWPVEIDETYIGGKTRGEGRGVHHMTIVVGAVEVREKKTPKGRRSVYAGRLRMGVVSDRGAETLQKFVTDNVQPGAAVITDGWVGYDGLTRLGYLHKKAVLHGDPERAEEFLPMVHLLFSNLKTWLQGTHHGVSQQHLPAYINEFVFRFNRRFYPMTSFNSVLGIGMDVPAPTYEGLYSGEWVHPNPPDDQWTLRLPVGSWV